MALTVNCIDGMGAARRQPIPFSHAGPFKGNEACFVVGDQGFAARKIKQDILDHDGDEYPDGDQLQATVVTHSIH